MSFVWHDVHRNLVWNIGDGSKARFCLDLWIGNGDPIVAYLGVGLTPANINASLQIAAMKATFGIRIPDQFCWG
ncbi:hypothetical protein V6N13_094305 [Hibiscus sabdariffa]